MGQIVSPPPWYGRYRIDQRTRVRKAFDGLLISLTFCLILLLLFLALPWAGRGFLWFTQQYRLYAEWVCPICQ